jgi:putative transferase (TIGR04331 family)
MAKLLVTTSLEQTWGSDEEIFFIGEWCKEYNQKYFYEKRHYSVLPYHWADRRKLKKDHDYLEELYERVLMGLAEAMNKNHGVEKSLRYWRIILGPWLLTYISIIWDRWENLRIAFEKQSFDATFIIDYDILNIVPKNYMDFVRLFQDQFWNHLIFTDILKSQFQQNVSFIKIPYCEENISHLEELEPKRSFKGKVLLAIDQIFGFLKRKYRVVFVTSYLSRFALLKIALRLRQLPRLHFEFDKIIVMPEPSSARSKLNLYLQTQNKFEEFIQDTIASHIPISYLEGYPSIVKEIDNIFPDCEIIFTANSHYGNELFKVWCAEKVEAGKKLIISEHGGSFRPSMSLFQHEEKISDTRTVWHIPLDKKHVKLSPYIKVENVADSNSNAEYITIIGLEFPLYSYRCQSGPNSSLILEDYNQKLEFANLLSPIVFEHLKICPHPQQAWNTRQRYIDDLGLDKISAHRTLDEAIVHSKLLVCTYPQTTFASAMHSGIPTILLYPQHFWETEPEFDDLLGELKLAKVIFTDPASAAQHINNVWNNIDLWWDAPQTVRAREHFFDICGRVKKDWVSEWVLFFKKY